MRSLLPLLLLLPACATPTHAPPCFERVQSWTLRSAALAEQRRVFVYLPRGYDAPDARLPVLYMPDGGIGEDLPHVVDAVAAGELWGTMQPVIVVGIENTDRRRDLTGPTDVPKDREIAPRAGGAAAFRTFLRDELMPEVERRYRTGGVTALVGESLAGLFVVETFLEQPELFDHCIAFSPSLWWNDAQLVARAPELLGQRGEDAGTLYLTTANEPGIIAATQRLVAALAAADTDTSWWHYQPMPEQFHDTIYRASAPRALRRTFPAPPRGR
ncbi:MAG: alpha/beta hydrolase [Planctomycetota bacterium]